MKKLLWIPVLGAIVLSFSCSKKNNPVNVTNIYFTYPLARGNQWQYSGQFFFFNLRGDTTISPNPDTTTSTIVLEITRQELLPNNVLAFVLHEIVDENSPLLGQRRLESEAFYNNFKDGLFLYGWRGGSNTIPKKKPDLMFKSGGSYFTGPAEIMAGLNPDLIRTQVMPDTLFLLDSASKSLQYPMEPGESWTHSTSAGTIKRVLEVVDVAVPAGTFECVKVEWQVGDNLEFFDYISIEGLIKRTLVARDIIVTSGNQPDDMGVIVDFANEYVLTNFNIIK